VQRATSFGMRHIRALAVIALIIALHAELWGGESVRVLVGNRPLLIPLALALMVSVALHELLHVAGYVWVGGAPMEAVHVEWRGAAIVARCEVPLPAWSYRVAVALPGLVLGVLPALLGLTIGVAWLTVYGAVMAGASAGDVAVLWALRRYGAEEKVEDRSGRGRR